MVTIPFHDKLNIFFTISNSLLIPNIKHCVTYIETLKLRSEILALLNVGIHLKDKTGIQSRT